MPFFFGLKLTTQMSEQVGIEVNCLAHIIERTGLVTSLHTKRTTKLIDFGIFRMESINLPQRNANHGQKRFANSG